MISNELDKFQFILQLHKQTRPADTGRVLCRFYLSARLLLQVR